MLVLESNPPTRARIYLDIDGCLSPLPPRPSRELRWEPPGTWPEWVDPEAFNQTPMPVALLDALDALGGVEVVWASSWRVDMIDWALLQVGYDHIRLRHLNPDGGATSKLEAVRADIAEDPLPFVWVDDARLPGEEFWIPPVPWRRVRPQPQFGITVLGWEAVIEWLGRARSWEPTGDPVRRFTDLWRRAVDDALAADPWTVTNQVMTNIAIHLEIEPREDPAVLAALERWKFLLDDEAALAELLRAAPRDWAWETAPPFADVLPQAEHQRLVDTAYSVPLPVPPAADGYVRPERPTGERGRYTWRDDNNIRTRLDITRRLRSDADTVLDHSKESLRTVRYAEHLADFWGSMIWNDDIEGLIHYHAEDLPVYWYHGHPVTWPGKSG